MPKSNPDLPPPFDHGVFLMHYNRGREAFQQGRFAEARTELETSQRLRPEDSDVLNLLGLVYFKTNAYPEAEVIYRRLIEENPNVFILHSNLGLILFKEGKLEEAEQYLLKSVELRPNYAKSHLYLGLLYRQRKKYGIALEHLRFAGADKAVRETEAEMKGGHGRTDTAPIPVMTQSDLKPKGSSAFSTQPGVSASHTAARKLQNAVDEETRIAEKGHLDLGRKIEGASRTFALHDNGFLEINFRRSVYVKRGTISSYSGNLRFVTEKTLAGTTAAMLVKAEGQGKIFIYEKGRKTFLLDLNDEFIYVEGANLLAVEESLTCKVEPIYDRTYQQKIDTLKVFGKGSLAISTSIEPLTLRVTRDYPLSISSSSLVAWTGNLIPAVIEGDDLSQIMTKGEDQSFKVRFEGDGVVVSES
jgi:uncharacterized protein (AIM24 family)